MGLLALMEQAQPMTYCNCPLWCLHCTFITGDERLRSALKGGRNDGAVSVRENVLRVVVDIFPAVGAGLRDGNREERQR